MRMKVCFYIYHNNKSTYKDLDGGEKKYFTLRFGCFKLSYLEYTEKNPQVRSCVLWLCLLNNVFYLQFFS